MSGSVYRRARSKTRNICAGETQAWGRPSRNRLRFEFLGQDLDPPKCQVIAPIMHPARLDVLQFSSSRLAPLERGSPRQFYRNESKVGAPMALVEVVLESSEITLTLIADDTGWCTVSALLGAERHDLGADRFQVIRERILGAITDLSPIVDRGTIAGMPVRCVLMLYERHASVYAAIEGDMLHVFFQGPSGNLIGRGALNAEERAAWRQKLVKVQTA